MDNPYDQFDSSGPASAGSNPYDSFDKAPATQQQGAKEAPSLGEFLMGAPRKGHEQSGLAHTFDLTDVGHVAKKQFAGVGNTVDRAWTALAALLAETAGSKDDIDEIYKNLQERIASRNGFDTSTHQPGFASSVVGAIPNLPSSILTFPLSPFETGQKMIENGETLPTALKGVGIQTVGNELMAALPNTFGSTLGKQIASGAVVNAGQTYGVGKALSAISETPQGKAEFDPTLEGVAQSALLGGVMGPMLTPKKEAPPVTNSKFKALEALDKAKEEQKPLYVNKEGDVTNELPGRVTEDPATTELARLRQQNELEQVAREAEMPKGQMELPFEGGEQIPMEYSFLKPGEERINPPLEATKVPDALKQELAAQVAARRITPEDAKYVMAKVAEFPEPKIPVPDVIEHFDESTLPRPNLSVVPPKQRGAVNLGDIVDETKKAVQNLRDRIDTAGQIRAPIKTVVEEYLTKNIPGAQKSFDDSITRPDAPTKIVADASAYGKDLPPVWNALQSGPILTASKAETAGHPLVLGVGRWLQYGIKKTENQVKSLVQPLERYYSSMKTSDMEEISQLYKREMLNRNQYTPEELAGAGFSERQITAYKMQRAAFEAARNIQNSARAAAGQEPITRENAYLSSQWYGDYHAPILDKTGKLVWYIRTSTRAEALRAIDYLRKNFGDTLNITDKTQPEYRPSKVGPDTPKDVMGAYQDMLGFFSDKPEISNQIKEAMAQYAEEKGYGVLGQSKHFESKGNVRGFAGDQPWKSSKEQAFDMAKAQISYLRNAIKWANMQEGMENIKQVLNDPKLAKEQPNAMEYVKQVVANQYGIPSNIMKPLEDAIARLVPVVGKEGVTFGVSRSDLLRGTQDLKSMTYLQMLGLSPAYMIATPLQSLMNAPSWHRILTNEGFKHNIAKTTFNAMMDFSAGIVKHYADEVSGKDVSVPMTKLGKEALKYAEDNGIVSKNLFDEYSGLGEHPAVSTLKNTVGATISFPEKLARLSTFMGFAHHLEASGKFKDKLEMFRKAEEYTNNSLTDFRSSERPLIVDNLGATGQMLYTFKSFLFNQFNQLSVFSREAAKGRPGPLLAALGMMTVLGGIKSLPGVNEMDGFWNLVKDLFAEKFPQHYSKVSGPGLKGTIIGMGSDLAAYGAVSKLMNTQMSSRFSPGIIDPEKPLQGVAPVIQEAKEWASAGNVITHPNKTTATEAAYVNSPALIKGNMEIGMDIFKGPKKGDKQAYVNPNHLEDHATIYDRTKEDEAKRRMGMTSLPEAKTKERDYIAKQETARIETAKGHLIDRAFDAVIRGDQAEIESNARAYLQLNPSSGDLTSELNQKIRNYAFTPQQKAITAAKTASTILRVKRRLDMDKND